MLPGSEDSQPVCERCADALEADIVEVGGTSLRSFKRAGLLAGGVLGGGFLMMLLMGAAVVGAFVLFLRWAWHS